MRFGQRIRTKDLKLSPFSCCNSWMCSGTRLVSTILEELKDRIQAGDFDEANSSVLALLVRMRQVKEVLSASKE